MPPPIELSTEIPDWFQEYAEENNIDYAVSEERSGIFQEQFEPDPLAPHGTSLLRVTVVGDERVVTNIQLETTLYSAHPDAAATIAAGWRVLLHTIDPDLSADGAEADLDALGADSLSQIPQDPDNAPTLVAEWTGKATCTAVYITQTVVLSCDLS